jgi:prepilin-type N-terminal cleavage/methylation domain-containing protein
MRALGGDKGFTLVELMVVVLIIGILVGIAIPIYRAMDARARERSCQSNLRSLNGVLEQWKAAGPANDPITRWGGVGVDKDLASAGSLVADLGPYFRDFDGATKCRTDDRYYTVTILSPGAGQLGAATFVCPNGHTY